MRIALVDYGLGNVQSMVEAIHHIGHEPLLDEDGSSFRKSSVVVVPGVAEFGAGMRNLRESGLAEAITRHGLAGNSIVGVCLGAQMLLGGSDESPEVTGLGLVAGWVKALDSKVARVPNQGWWLTGDTSTPEESGSYFYYSHRFWCDVQDSTCVRQRVLRHPERPVASFRSENYTGVQFHPERSGWRGLDFLGRVLASCSRI